MKQEYDYIIVGAGSAGCVLANRLSADPATSVLLVESGPDDRSPFIHMPRGIGLLLKPGSKHIWSYDARPSGNGETDFWFKGRGIGGSSSINGMVYVRGAPLDYDHWASLGCTGWGWDEMGPIFVRIENHALGADETRGDAGPLRISVHPSGDPLCEAILDTAAALGTPRVADVNAPAAVRDGGMGYLTRTTWKGKRFSAAAAFLKPARNRRNLTVVTDTDVLRVDFDGRRATGVTLRDKAGTRHVRANRETILSAGAIQTPKLLQLSGIGPADLLNTYGIPLVADLPGVGRNLREHFYMQTKYEVRGDSSSNRHFGGFALIRALLRYVLRKQGPLTHAAQELGGFVKTVPGLDHADSQVGVTLASYGMQEKGVGIDPFPGIIIMSYFTRPESQGEIRIQSADPDASPLIDARHFSTEIDRQKAVAIFHWLRALGRQRPLADWIVRETSPGPDIQTDDDVLANLGKLGGIGYHICGTARMGSDEGAVLDPQLRVRGVSGLRVADTSIMPTIVSGNTNAPAMAIAMRCADFILDGR